MAVIASKVKLGGSLHSSLIASILRKSKTANWIHTTVSQATHARVGCSTILTSFRLVLKPKQ